MKPFKLAILTLLVGLVVTTAYAQDKQTNDATVSTHNYKHPNKAEAARQLGTEASIEFRRRPGWGKAKANYKDQKRNDGLPVAAIAIPVRGTAASPVNYKQQNRLVSPQKKEAKVQETAVEPAAEAAN